MIMKTSHNIAIISLTQINNTHKQTQITILIEKSPMLNLAEIETKYIQQMKNLNFLCEIGAG